ncbi:glycosyltransferase family 87 protein [Acidicapsa acidisoli]|uniref:glycosyltransferase family 87 protein n=1 Tax=Acidicapsa acidisoli TaxID=1615681 RepID=UPI0021E0EECA|nr:glycosyltransferase family 87 protein [Acidicapsa acidisoli]
MKTIARPLNLRAIVEFFVVAVCTVTFALTAVGVCSSLLGRDSAGSRDFVEYWAAGHQLIYHKNPYDAEALLGLERSIGFPQQLPAIIMGNPPSALLLVLPLGFVGAKTGELIWELLLFASLAASVQMIRTMYGTTKNLLHLLAYSFAPVLSCLLSGQITIFLLIGLTLFLRLHRSYPFWAGASLWLCLLKPHLFLPFGVVLALWIIRTRSFRVLGGTAFALAVSSAIVTIMNPLVWMQYAEMMRQERLDRVLIPSPSTMLRQYVYPHTLWLQCLPAGIGCVWALAYFLKRRTEWDWVRDGSLLMLVSVFVAPYTWFMDQAVLVPALLRGAYLTPSRTLIAILALMSAVIEIALLRKVPLLHSAFYVWSAPGFLVWYLFAIRSQSTRAALEVVPEPVEAQ